jgi:hypothetical protein
MTTDIKFTIRQIPYQPGTEQDINQNNLTELTPFRAWLDPQTNHRVLAIHKSFHAKLSAYSFIYDQLSAKFEEIRILEDSEQFPPSAEQDETGYWLVYRAWCRMYNADIWHTVFGNLVEIVGLTPEEHHKIRLLTKLPEPENRGHWLNKLIQRLDYQIQILQRNCGQSELFIKTSAKSTKHDVRVQPVTCAADALNYLLSSPTIQGVLARSEETVEFLLRPWNLDVSDDNEIRVFIQGRRIKAVSQQYIYASSPVLGMFMTGDPECLYEKIADKWHEIQQCTKYQDAVLDMYVTPSGDVELIEVNCGGSGWGPAGSSLFTWAEINAVTDGECIMAYY